MIPATSPHGRIVGSEQPDPALITQDMSMIQNMMWNYVGLVRNKHRLDRALSELRHLETEIERFYRKTKVTDELIGLRNAVRSAVIVAQAAWRTSRASAAIIASLKTLSPWETAGVRALGNKLSRSDSPCPPYKHKTRSC